MRILVTGADGFLGSATVDHLRSTGRTVIASSRRAAGREGTVHCDLENPADTARLFDQVGPTHVVNLAARIDFGANTLAALYPVNVLAPAILAAQCKRNRAHLVQASSIQVQAPARVNEPLGTAYVARTDYGVSKWLAERAITAAGCSATIVRFAGIFGQNGPDHLGINRAIRAAQGGVAPTLVGRGTARRNYVHVQDAARMIATALTENLTGLYNCGGETLSIRLMLEAICDEWLPGTLPVSVPGDESADQLVEVSPELGPFRTFRACLGQTR